MLSQIKQYVAEMGVTDNFYQQMVNTEPARMLKYDLLASEALIPRTDPVYEEVEISYDARRYGVTTSEMRQRQQEAAADCEYLMPTGQGILEDLDALGHHHICSEAMKWGLSQRVYRQRQEKVEAECKISDRDGEILDATPKKIRRDHPISVRWENCVRTIMLNAEPR
jgi:hypothetical protein